MITSVMFDIQESTFEHQLPLVIELLMEGKTLLGGFEWSEV